MHLDIQNDSTLKPGLYLVSTPIGNLEDISIRALKLFSNADCIFCEDTRITNKLLSRYGIKKKLYSYNDHSAAKDRDFILNKILDKKICLLVSDAGTPLISDPGFKLVKFLQDRNIFITAIPGPCALINALIMSGVDSDEFSFHGFLPQKKTERIKKIHELSNGKKTSIIYESSKKINFIFETIAESNPNFSITIVREMTKLYEELITDTVSNLRDKAFKGELVVIFHPNNTNDQEEKFDEKILTSLREISTKDGQYILKKIYPNISNNQLYDLLKN